MTPIYNVTITPLAVLWEIQASMATNGLPISLYEDLLPKLVAVLELTQQTVGISTPEAKQKLLQTVCFINMTSGALN